MNERRQEPPRPPPRDSQSRRDPKKATECGEREKRLAASLRENLRRRKEQARARDAALPEGGEEGPERTA